MEGHIPDLLILEMENGSYRATPPKKNSYLTPTSCNPSEFHLNLSEFLSNHPYKPTVPRTTCHTYGYPTKANPASDRQNTGNYKLTNPTGLSLPSSLIQSTVGCMAMPHVWPHPQIPTYPVPL